MKKTLVMLFVFVCFAVITHAQLNSSPYVSPDSVKKELPGKLFVQLTNAINSTSFTSSFAKERKSLITKTNAVNNNPKAFAKSVSSLAGYIKPDMFKSNFNLPNIQNSVTTVKTMDQAIGILKDVESGLKPEALSGIWKLQRNGWLSEMNSLK